MTIDLGPAGKAGVEARVYQRTDGYVVYVLGTDHWRDWLHHFLPGAKRREHNAAKALFVALSNDGITKDTILYIYGFSWGGALAAMLGYFYPGIPVYIYAGKRTDKRSLCNVTQSYRHRGDVVPYLPPWRPRYNNIVFGTWQLPWRAHRLSNYREVMR